MKKKKTSLENIFLTRFQLKEAATTKKATPHKIYLKKKN
jgi:hypothetical protein